MEFDCNTFLCGVIYETEKLLTVDVCDTAIVFLSSHVETSNTISDPGPLESPKQRQRKAHSSPDGDTLKSALTTQDNTRRRYQSVRGGKLLPGGPARAEKDTGAGADRLVGAGTRSLCGDGPGTWGLRLVSVDECEQGGRSKRIRIHLLTQKICGPLASFRPQEQVFCPGKVT